MPRRRQTCLYFRFFSASRVSAEREARRTCLDDRPGAVALLGLLGDELVGVASYELAPVRASVEVALAVADGMHLSRALPPWERPVPIWTPWPAVMK